MGRAKTPLRELVRSVLEKDPEISFGELAERYPNMKTVRLRAALVRERADLGITEWRLDKRDDGSVVLMVAIPGPEYERLRDEGDGRVALALAEHAREIVLKKE